MGFSEYDALGPGTAVAPDGCAAHNNLPGQPGMTT